MPAIIDSLTLELEGIETGWRETRLFILAELPIL